MSSTKRLFLFAGFDKNNIINSALVYYIKTLSIYGDVVVCMDSECNDTEQAKLKTYTIHSIIGHHGEYDFGSYKRGFIWAKTNLDLTKYNYLYLVNDSVFGPIFPLKEYLIKMESLNLNAFGMVKMHKNNTSHIESWFIGMTPTVFLSEYFNTFLINVKKQMSKGAITLLYEKGFSRLLEKNNVLWDTLFSVYNRQTYNNIKYLYNRKMPFIKKASFTRHNGSLGNQISYVLNHINTNTKNIILDTAINTYGKAYMKYLLTNNIFKILYRKTTYFLKKLFSEGL